MSETTSTSTFGFFIKQAQSVIAFTYLMMVGVGMFFYHQKFSEFGINIFQYADILYFMIAPFEDGLILLLCTIMVVVFGLSIALERIVSKKYPKIYTMMHFGMNKKSWFSTYQNIFYPLSVVFLLYIYSDVYGNRTKKEILASDPVTIEFSDEDAITAKMIGKTQTVIFLLEGNKVKAIPLESVKEIGIGVLPAEKVPNKQSDSNGS